MGRGPFHRIVDTTGHCAKRTLRQTGIEERYPSQGLPLPLVSSVVSAPIKEKDGQEHKGTEPCIGRTGLA